MANQPKVFISYSRVDTDFIENIYPLLGRKYGFENIWYDDWLHGGDDWWKTILEHVAWCDIFIYILSNEAVTSEYCQAEFAEAQRLSKHIITIQVRDRTKLDDTLSSIQFIDMKPGVNETEAITRLFTSIDRVDVARVRRRRARWSGKTPKPSINSETGIVNYEEVDTPVLTSLKPLGRHRLDEPSAIIWAAVIGGFFMILAALIGPIASIFPTVIGQVTPSMTPTVSATQPVSTNSLTFSSSPTFTLPSTLTMTQITQTEIDDIDATARVSLDENNELETDEQFSQSNPDLIILSVEGEIGIRRREWGGEQPAMPGMSLRPDDILVPDGDFSLTILCNGDVVAVRNITQAELTDGGIDCFAENMFLDEIVLIQRGGTAGFGLPYLIFPRATAVRNSQVSLTWATVPDAHHYFVTVLEDTNIIWKSENLSPVENDTASIMLPIILEEQVAYTVEICVMFEDLRGGCTSDPGSSSSTNLAFYYIPNPAFDSQEDLIIAEYGEDTAISLFARASLLSETVFEPSSSVPIGYYGEAITLLEQIIENYPEDPLVGSANLYNQLGELYRSINLPTHAVRHFDTALQLASSGTEASAVAALGLARTTQSGDIIYYYDLALNEFAAYMTDAAFYQTFRSVCNVSGDICLDFERCTQPQANCSEWFLERG